MIPTSVCSQEALTSEAFRHWLDLLPLDRMAVGAYVDPAGRPLVLHRKVWEWLFIAEVLRERGMLQPGRRGLGFGVGNEPLVALFASFGCEIVATDLDPAGAAEGGWVETGQHASGLTDLNRFEICPKDAFERLVSFRTVDMNDVPPDLVGFDFCWSACALEHLGSIARGQDFVIRSLACLRPGGVAAHTTEYNLSSNRATVDDDGTVLFRRRDVEWIVGRARSLGCRVDPPDLRPATQPADRHIDVPPYSKTHLRVKIERYVTTSLGMVIERGTSSPPREAAAEQLWRLRRVWAEKVLDASVADPHELRTRLGNVSDAMWARERYIRRRLRDGLRRRLPFGPPVVVPPVPYRSAPAVVAYLVWRTLPGDDVTEIVGDWPPCGEAVRITGKTMREARLESLQELPLLPAASGGADVAILLDVVQRVRPADVPQLAEEVARITRRYAFVTVPSFGVDVVSPPDGTFHGKVRAERVAHYEALGLDYDGPVPADDVDPGFAPPDACTVASVAWWTERFADAGLIRCAGVEQRLVPHLHRFEAYGRWKIFVLRRLEIAEPVGELHPDAEIVEMAVQLGLEPL